MKTVRIELVDADAEALSRAAAESGYPSSADLARALIKDFLDVVDDYDAHALERDVARHEDEKRRGEPGFGLAEARAWLQ